MDRDLVDVDGSDTDIEDEVEMLGALSLGGGPNGTVSIYDLRSAEEFITSVIRGANQSESPTTITGNKQEGVESSKVLNTPLLSTPATTTTTTSEVSSSLILSSIAVGPAAPSKSSSDSNLSKKHAYFCDDEDDEPPSKLTAASAAAAAKVSKVVSIEERIKNSKLSIKALEEATKILKSGIPVVANSEAVCDAVVTVFSILKGTYPLTDDLPEAKLQPLEVSREVIALIGNVIGEWKDFFNIGANRRQLIHEGLRSKFKYGEFCPGTKDDFAVFIRYKPMELIGDMITFIILALLGGDFTDAQNTSYRLKKVLEDPEIYKGGSMEQVYAYLQKSIDLFMKTLHSTNPDAVKDEVIPSDQSWSEEMLRNRFLIWFVVERHLLNIEECQGWASDLMTQNVHDVEWLITVASTMRQKRLKTAFPRKIDPVENQLVKEASSVDPENPFVILSLLDILSDKKKKLSQDFVLSCQNLIHKYGKSVHINLRVAKYFLIAGRNRDFGIECLRRAVFLNPKNAQANYLCGKHLCKPSTKPGLGLGVRAIEFFRISINSDMSNFEAVFEYFKCALGRIRTSGPTSLFDPMTSDEGGIGLHLLNGAPVAVATCLADTSRYSEMINDILNGAYTKAWSTVQRARLQFLSALSFYIRAEPDEAMELMLSFYRNNQIVSMMRSMDDLCDAYDWDKSRLSSDKFLQWLRMEYDDMGGQMEVEKNYEEIDEDDEDYDDEDYAEDHDEDPLKDMLAYLLRVLQ